MPHLPHFSDFIRMARELDNMTAKDAAQALGWSMPRWNAFEQGQALTRENVKTAALLLHLQPWIIQNMAGSRAMNFCYRPWDPCKSGDMVYRRKAMGDVIRKSRDYNSGSITEAVQG